MRSSDAIVDGPVVSLASPWLAAAVGRGVELFLDELRRDGHTLPANEDANTLRMLVAIGRERRAGGSICATPQIACAAPASGATTAVMLTTRDVAKRLDVTRQRVRQWADTRELPGEKDDLGRWRFAEAAVANFEAKRTGGTRHG